MDTTKFELTEHEKIVAQEEYIKRAWSEVKVQLAIPLRGWRREECLLKAQVSKVLSLLEPVQLEALGEDEIDNLRVPPNELWNYKAHMRNASQATIEHNQAKGQLYRRSEKE